MHNDEIIDEEYLMDPDQIQVVLITPVNFVLLYLLTFGIYGYWWMYKHWRFFQQKELSGITPAARAIFAVFFLHTLFEKILLFAKTQGYKRVYSSSGLYVVFILAYLASRLPDPYWIISFLGFTCFIQPIEAMNYAVNSSDDYQIILSPRLNQRQLGLAIVGGLFWLLIMAGFLLPEDY